MIDIVIVGAGGFAREVQDVVRDLGAPFRLVGFIDDFVLPGKDLHGAPVLGPLGWLENNKGFQVVVGVGAPQTRKKIVQRLSEIDPCIPFATLIHPSTIKSPFVEIGEGSVVCAGSILTNNIRIGKHVHLNLGTTVGHDAVVEDFSTTAPGVHVNGNNFLGEGSYLGTGANFREKIRVGRWSVIGAGAAVVKDVPDNATAVGCPAKVIKVREEGWENE